MALICLTGVNNNSQMSKSAGNVGSVIWISETSHTYGTITQLLPPQPQPRHHIMICGSGTDSEISLCGSIRPPLMYNSSFTTTSSPRTLTFSIRAFTYVTPSTHVSYVQTCVLFVLYLYLTVTICGTKSDGNLKIFNWKLFYNGESHK